MGLFASRGSSFQALLTELVPGSHRGPLMSLTAATGQVGFAVSGALAGAIYAGVEYAASTLLSAAGCLLLAVVAWRYLPEPAADITGRMPGENGRSLTETAHRQSGDALCGPYQEIGHMVDHRND